MTTYTSFAPGETVDGWDPRDNVQEDRTVGSNEFRVHHFKGVAGSWAKAGPNAGRFVVYGSPRLTEYWSVSLPHQCEDWDIAGDAVVHASTVTGLEKFITEAQQALDVLRRMG